MLTDAYGRPLGHTSLGSIMYEMDYFASSQIFLMIGDVLIDTAVSISYGLQQSKTPIWGYASQYYSFVADGHIFVSGNLVIAFKESAYMLYPIKRFLNLVQSHSVMVPDDINSPRYRLDDKGNFVNYYSPKTYTLAEASAAARNKKNILGNVEQMKSFESDAYNPEQKAQKNQLWLDLGKLPDNEFEDWAEAFEDVVWYGAERINPYTRDQLYANNLRSSEPITDNTILSHRRPDLYPEVDLTIIYGDVSAASTNHTAEKILDVSFIGSGKTIAIDNGIVYDKFDFIARTVV